MSRKKSKLEHSLGGHLAGVNPLEQNRVKPYRKPVSPLPQQRLLDNQRVMEELLAEPDETTSYESGDELKFLRSGYSNQLLKKLRRGEFAIQDELDLHGLVVSEAKQETHGFINECARVKVRAIRIVHGKGRNSAGRQPVLKNMLLGWLSKNKHVIAVCSTPANDGGTGAVYVLLGK
ncbi:MAG: Smr/MutS family protein [Arenicella sp.]|nr:Smr/MutS family protein [Arenicella sp.]